MSGISLCMIVRNEADTIARCLGSALRVVDEIIVVDTGSTDDTVAICRSFGARIHSVTWMNDFAAARNYSLEQASGAWILILDADDELPPETKKEIRALTETEDCDAFFFTTVNLVGDIRHPTVLKYAQMRLFRNQSRFRYVGSIHEIIPRFPEVRYSTAPVSVIHYGYLDTLVQSRLKVERNVSLLKEAMERHPFDPSLHYYMGNECLRAGRPLEATQHYEQAVSLLQQVQTEHGLSDLPPKYANALWQSGKVDSAIEVVCQATARTPAYTDLWFLLGSLYLDQRRHDLARTAFEECLRMGESPSIFPTQEGCGTYRPALLLGVIELEEKNTASARAYLEQSLSWKPDCVPAFIQLCLCDWIEERFAAVGERILALLERESDGSICELVRLINDSLVTGRVRIRLDDPNHTSSFLTCLSTLASFGHVTLPSRLLYQLPSNVRQTATSEMWYYELATRYWLGALGNLEASAR